MSMSSVTDRPTQVNAPFAVDAAYMRKHDPQIGGYYVQYDDGYKIVFTGCRV
jgi:hypothetical protein